jgi:hypothetical protein
MGGFMRCRPSLTGRLLDLWQITWRKNVARQSTKDSPSEPVSVQRARQLPQRGQRGHWHTISRPGI